jgi:hypothetical protein
MALAAAVFPRMRDRPGIAARREIGRDSVAQQRRGSYISHDLLKRIFAAGGRIRPQESFPQGLVESNSAG